MFLAVRGVAPCLPPVLHHSCRIYTRRTYGALTKNRSLLKSDVIETIRIRNAHGKGEASHDLEFLPLRWSKQLWGKMFGKYLLVTNVLGSGLLMAVGDFIAQEIEFRGGLKHHHEDRYDGQRMFRMFVAGALQGPLHHYVYNWMDRVMPHRTFRNIVKKILIDQLFMSPACILIFFYTVCYLEGQSLHATHQELIAKFPYIYLLDWATWPAAQYVNFRYLDTKYRVAFVNVCTAVYNVLMSYMKHDFGIHLPIEPNTSGEILTITAEKTTPKVPSELTDEQKTGKLTKKQIVDLSGAQK